MKKEQSGLIDRYELLDELGRGGAGVVYRARQLTLNRLIALKLLLNARLLDPAEVQRLKKEAEIVAQLRHPNIVTVHEVGEEDGQPWLAMELVEGRDLARVVGNTPLPASRAAALVRRISLGIDYAHRKGVLHRDLKPSNIVLDTEEQPRITDFGLAIRSAHEPVAETSSAGTPSYMAPESLDSGQPASKATDVWGLGAILYHLVTGRPPFVGSTREEITRQVIAAELLGPRQVNPSVPRDLETICLKCLRKNPADRYASARELADDLQCFSEGLPVRARPISPLEKSIRWVRRKPLPAALFVFLVICLAGWIASSEQRRRGAAAAARQAQTAADERRKLLTHQYLARAYEALENREPARALPWLIEGWRNDRAGLVADPSVDRAFSMRIAAVLQQTPRLVALWPLPPRADSVEISPDGMLAAAGGPERTVVWNTETHAKVYEWAGEMPASKLKFSPDGAMLIIAYSGDLFEGRTTPATRIAVRNIRTGKLESEWNAPGKLRSIELSADGRHLAAGWADGTLRVWSFPEGELLSAPMKQPGEIRALAFSLDGSVLFSASFDGTGRAWDWRSGNQKARMPHNGYVRDIRLSPSGLVIATGSDDGEVRIWDAKNGARLPAQPMVHKGRVVSIAFSKNGNWIASASGDGTARVWNAATGDPVTPPMNHPHRVGHARFNDDASCLLTSTSDGLITAWDLPSGVKRFAVTQAGNAGDARWLPNDRGFVTSGLEGLARQWLLPNGTEWARELALPDGANAIAASPFGSEAVIALDGGRVVRWDWKKNSALSIHLQRGNVAGAGFCGDLIWSYLRTGPVRFSDRITGKDRFSLPSRGIIRSFATSPNQQQAAVGTDEGDLELWSLGGAAPLLKRSYHFPGRVECLSYANDSSGQAGAWFEPDANNLARNRFTVRIWNGGAAEVSTPVIPGDPADLAFDPYGRFLAVASTQGSAYLLERGSGRVLHRLKHPAEVMSVVFGRDGNTLLTAGGSGVVRIWDAASGELLTSRFSHRGLARARFNRDQSAILTWGRDLRAQLWDAAAREPLLPPFWHSDTVSSALFSADERAIITLGKDQKVRVWEIPATALTFESARLICRLTSSHAADPTGSVVALPAEELVQLWAAHLRR